METMTKKGAQIEDATCQGPGDVQGKCGRPTLAHRLCSTHARQLHRANGDKSKLRPITKPVPNPEARGRISHAAAALISRYGQAQLEMEKGKGRARKPLWRGTQIVLEAFARGELVWRDGAEPPQSPEPNRKSGTRRRTAPLDRRARRV